VTGLHYIANDLQLYHVIAPSGWMNDFFDWDELAHWAFTYPPDVTLGAAALPLPDPPLAHPVSGAAAPSVSAGPGGASTERVPSPETLDSWQRWNLP
jgi:hypothetical protein